MELNPKFKISKEYLASSDVEELKFIFEQAEKHLKITIESSAAIVTRTTILLTIVVTLFTSIAAYLIREISQGEKNYELILTAALTAIYLFWQILELSKNIKGHRYQSLGSEPATLLNEYYFYECPELAERKKLNYLSEIDRYQERIDAGKRINDDRWKSFHRSFDAIRYFPVFITVTFLIIRGIVAVISCVC